MSAIIQREKDESDLFEIPVAEAYPDAADDYLAAIPFPMDFRTIEEERLLVYCSVEELQEDLILVFGNCINYNEQDSPFLPLQQGTSVTGKQVELLM